METPIPSTESVRAQLAALTTRQVTRLSVLSGIPDPTLVKIKYGQTLNPGIETVRAFLPHIETVRKEFAQAGEA